MSLGENIVRLRTQRGLSQEELADRLGVSRQSVSKWETDGSVPELEKLMKLGELFEVSLDVLVKGDSFTDIPQETVQETEKAEPSAPARRKGARWAGYVYLVIGAVISFVLGIWGGGWLALIFGLPFYISAVICLTAKGERTGLWCGWCLFFLVDAYLRYGTGLSWGVIFQTLRWTARMNYTRLIIAWCQFLVMLFFILWTAFSYGKEPWPEKERWKGNFLVRCAGVLCTTFLIWTFGAIMARGHFFTGPLYIALAMGRTLMDYCRMLLVGLLAAQLIQFRAWKARKRTED